MTEVGGLGPTMATHTEAQKLIPAFQCGDKQRNTHLCGLQWILIAYDTYMFLIRCCLSFCSDTGPRTWSYRCSKYLCAVTSECYHAISIDWAAVSHAIIYCPYAGESVTDVTSAQKVVMWVEYPVSKSKLLKWLYTLPETNSSPLKIDPWKRRFLLETTIFRGYVSFRECNPYLPFTSTT